MSIAEQNVCVDNVLCDYASIHSINTEILSGKHCEPTSNTN